MSGRGNNSWDQFYGTPGTAGSGTRGHEDDVYVPNTSHIPDHPTPTLPDVESTPTSTPRPAPSSSSRHGRQDRRIAYSPPETERLFATFVATSEDPIVGTQQTSNVFWRKVEEVYNEGRDPALPERTDRMLRAHYERVNPEIKKFAGIYCNEERRCSSGVSEATVLAAALKIFQQDLGKPFKYLTTWRMVRHLDLWAGGLESSSDSSSKRTKHTSRGHYSTSGEGQSAPSEPEHDVTQPTSRHRPIGTKAAKAARGKGRAGPSLDPSQAIPADKTALWGYLTKFMTTDTSNLSPEMLEMHMNSIKALQRELGILPPSPPPQ